MKDELLRKEFGVFQIAILENISKLENQNKQLLALLEGLEVRVNTLEEARQVQIKINTKALGNMEKLEVIEKDTWWHKIRGINKLYENKRK